MKSQILPIALLAVALPLTAAAQETVRGARGFPIGEKSKIHTELDLGVGFDSNPPRRVANLSDWKAQFRPGLGVEVPGQSFRLSLRSKVFIEQYFGTTGAAEVSGGSTTKFGGDVGLDLAAGSDKSVVGLELKDTLARTPTFFSDLGSVGTDEIRFIQWQNRGAARLVLRPGGGALEFRLGYGNELHLYDDLPKSQRHAAELEAKLKFLPKTAVIFGADLSFFSATQPAAGTGTRRSSPYNIQLGLQGQITPRFSTILRAGFGDSLTWDGEFFSTVANSNVRTFIANASLSYAFMPGSSLTLGYDRMIRPVILLDAYTSDALSAKLQLTVATRLSFGLYGQFEFRNFAQNDTLARVITGDFRVEYWFFDWLRGGISYQVINQNTDVTAANTLLEEYTRHQAMAGIGFYY